MKIAGHIMGTPEYTVNEAIELFHKIGADGAEVVVRNGCCSGVPCDCDGESLSIVKRCAEENKTEVSYLTPHDSYFNSLDRKVRQAKIESIHRMVDYCQYPNARYIRIYGGNPLTGNTQNLEERGGKLIESLRYLGNLVARRDVVSIMENYLNIMAISAEDSAALVQDIDYLAVRILYDQTSLTSAGNEGYEEAIPLQQQYISYMHTEDLVSLEGKDFVSSDVSCLDESERNVRTRIVGEGILEWPVMLKSAKAHGCDGWPSLEYERGWHPDDVLDASIGMKKSIDYLKSILP